MKLIAKSKGLLKHWHVITFLLVVYDAFAVNIAYGLTLWMRFDCVISSIPKNILHAYLYFAPIYAVVAVLVFYFLKLYLSIWRFASYNELYRLLIANFILLILHAAGITLLFTRMPISYYVIGCVVQTLFTVGIRFSYRFVLLLRSRHSRSGFSNHIMIIGAGSAGQMLIRDIINGGRDTDNKVCCIIDDNSNKWGRYIDNIPIVGGRDDILASAEKYKINKIFFAVPSATPEERRDILNICNETSCELKQIPGIYQVIGGEVNVNTLREVSIEDLLGRKPIDIDNPEVFGYLSNRVVLVTGGGGSIGSELCRQIAAHYPKQLIIFDVYENNAYDIQLELKETFPELDLVTLIGSVRDSRRIQQVFDKYHPEIVFHAAAHKHVPLMEASPCEAIKNNVIGTYKTAYAAAAGGCKRFVLISTDKAVNPTNIMGASKRLCEMIIQSFDSKIKAGKANELTRLYTHASEKGEDLSSVRCIPDDACTEFVAVRFGNVLGSNGSVVPVFKKQIAHGGPVKVTHPDIIRYFMTIPEAVGLVLTAGGYAHGGEIFVLDMGSPVKIDTLARNLIKLSGLKPDVDIKIEYTGLRPGEKLYEEKLMAEEGLQTTKNKLIHIGNPLKFDIDRFIVEMSELMVLAYDNDERIVDAVEKVVPTFHPVGIGGQTEKDATYEKLITSQAR